MKSTSEIGATLVEYAIALAILVAAFAIGASFLYSAAQSRRDSSLDSQRKSLPCNGGLTGDDCL